MVDPEMNYVALYTIPDEIMASIQIKNFIEQVDEDDHVEKNNYLSPNTRIFVRDDQSKINGEYIVSKMTIPLAYNGIMSITATKAPERIK